MNDQWNNATPEQVIADVSALVDKWKQPVPPPEAEFMAPLRSTEPPPAELVDAVKKLVEAGAPLEETDRFPFPTLDGKEVIHGCVLGKGKDVRVWASKALAAAVRS